MLLESDLIPFTVASPVGNKSIVLSPHPDDETLGCGGTIRLFLKSKKHVKVVFLTSGDKADPSNKLSQIVHNENPPGFSFSNPPSPPFSKGGLGGLLNESHITEYALLREKEAVKALRILGASDYEFLRFPDRELGAYYENALERLLKIVEIYMPDTIYSPSMIELNPDHRTTAALSLEIQRRSMANPNLDMNRSYNTASQDAMKIIPPNPPLEKGGRGDFQMKDFVPVRLVFYEITTPLRPNILVDITPVYNKKKQAIKKYKSQLKLKDYFRHITALNTIRALTVNGQRYVEAFWHVDAPLNEEDIAKWLSYQRART
jgi:LmbE family N-acetylglucosaminyl deacetylase